MKVKNLIRVAIISNLILLLVSCAGENKQSVEIIRPVRYQEVKMYRGQQTRTFSGVSKASLETNLSFKVSGTIKQINAKVGNQVNAGQLIAVLDATDYKLQLEQTKSSLTQAEVQMRNAKSNYERISILYENGSTSINSYEQAKTTYESAKAIVNSTRKQVQLAQQSVNYTHLKVPISGRVANINAEINENVSAGFSVVTISSGSDIEVTVGMPESFIAMVKESDTVIVKFSSLPDDNFVGIVSEVSYTIGSESTTYPITINLENPSKDIRPGMTADIIFNLSSETGKEIILVPTVAVADDNAGNFVYVVEKLNGDTAIVHKRAVTVGNLTGEGIEISEGLIYGELVVTAGISKLSEGLKVKILD